MEKLKNWLKWLDNSILQILVIGYIFIIPLYPKLPLKMVNYTFVAIRLEDLYIAVLVAVFFLQFLRRKLSLNKKYLVLIGLFWLAVFASFLYNWKVSEIIVIKHLGLLHALRRVEYMIIFFIASATVQSKKDIKRYLNLIFATLALVCVYGMGQKFLGWPAVQTMNPEYAKGYILVLDAYARISSTFAGHYDLAAFLIFLIPIILGYYVYSSKKIYFGIFLLSLATLILTASRASYLSYIGAVTLYLLYIRRFKLLLVVILATALLTPLSNTLTSRLTRTFQQTQIFVDPTTGEVIVPKERRADTLPPGDFGAKVDTSDLVTKKATTVDKVLESETKAIIREQIVDEATRNGIALSEEEIARMVEEMFGTQVPITKYLIDISLSTRFQVSWPRAISAFTKNIFLGTGPSSMGEAVDGNYVRWLAEFGLFGTITFLYLLWSISKDVFQTARNISKSNSFRYVLFGFVFGTLGLFVNASYIDVFEASKVAYTFWLVAGISIASLPFYKTNSKKKKHVVDTK